MRSLGVDLTGGSGANVTVAAIVPSGALATQCPGRIGVGDVLIGIRGRETSCDRSRLLAPQMAARPDGRPAAADGGAVAAAAATPTFGWLSVLPSDTLAAVKGRLATAGDVVELRFQRCAHHRTTGHAAAGPLDRAPSLPTVHRTMSSTSPAPSPQFVPWDAGWQVLALSPGDVEAETADCGAGAGRAPALPKLHWKPINKVDPRCARCRKTLGVLIRRPGWCARCGEVTCSSCLTERRRLLADPARPEVTPRLDASGVLARVCPGCADDGKPSCNRGGSGGGGDGAALAPARAEPTVRSRSAIFAALRDRHRDVHREPSRHRSAAASSHSSPPPSYVGSDGPAAAAAAASGVDIRANCAKLVGAYGASVSKLSQRIGRALSLTAPAWIKVNKLEGKAAANKQCCKCECAFTLFKRHDACAICGRGFCGGCLFRSALLYLDATGQARITVLSADAKVPPRSEVVEACACCLDAVEEVVNARIKPTPATDVWKTLLPIDSALRNTSSRISTSLVEFTELVDSLRPDGPMTTSPGRGLVPRIAKHQSDLERWLATLRDELHKLKRIVPQSRAFETLLKNVILGRTTFLRETTSELREMNRVLELLLPPEVLAVVADTVNKDALTAATILVTQLAVESTLLESRALAMSLDGVGREVRGELRLLVDRDGPDAWDECLDVLTRTIKAQGAEAPLLRHMATMPDAASRMQGRVIEVLHHLRRQLEQRATLAKIGTILEALNDAIAKVPGQVIEADAAADGWEVL